MEGRSEGIIGSVGSSNFSGKVLLGALCVSAVSSPKNMQETWEADVPRWDDRVASGP